MESMPVFVRSALLFAVACGAAQADIQKIAVASNGLSNPAVGVWMDVLSWPTAARFIDADTQVNGNPSSLCGEFRVLIDGQTVHYFDHHHAYPRRHLPNSAIQQIQHQDAGAMIVTARVQPPESIRFDSFKLQYRAIPGCASPSNVWVRATLDQAQ